MKKIIVLSLVLVIISFLLVSCARQNPAGEATKFNYDKPIQQREIKEVKSAVPEKAPAILNLGKEVCNDGIDNDGNKLVDCSDLNSCYSPSEAAKNICAGKDAVDNNKILLTGDKLGYKSISQIKSLPNLQAYQSGEHACKTQLNVPCESVQVYLGNSWRAVADSSALKDQKITCTTGLGQGFYDLTKQYRAVCAPGVKTVNPPPVSGPTGILNK